MIVDSLKKLICAAVLGLAGVAAFSPASSVPPPPLQPLVKDVAPLPQPLVKDIASHLQDISVTIHANGSQGSGVIKTREGVNYVWTAAHVIDKLRQARQVTDPRSGAGKTVVEFRDAKVVKELIEDGRAVGRIEMDAEVIRYSDADNGEDLALLRIRKKNFVQESVSFYLKKDMLVPGADLLHCGSLLGQLGSNSVTSGIISQNGRVLSSKVYDQTTCAAFAGSSGGGVYVKKTGEYYGMIVRGAGETFNLMVPVRRMKSYAKRVKVEWALDDSIKVPTEDEIRAEPVEEIGSARHPDKMLPAKSVFKFLIAED